MTRAQELFDAAFSTPRDKRSAEYKAGCLAVLQCRAGEIEHTVCPYKMGTAQADAWLSGTSEGHLIWREAVLTGASAVGK